MGLLYQTLGSILLSLAPAKSQENQVITSQDTIYQVIISQDTIYLNYEKPDILQYSQDSLNKTINPKTPLVKEAVKYIGTPFSKWGRNEEKLPNLDCLGLVFLSYADTKEKNWRKFKFPVHPWQIIERNTFGKPVKGLDGVSRENIDLNLLKEGDIIHMLSTIKYDDWIKPIKNINGVDLFGHHLGIYTGDKKWIHCNPYSQFKTGVIVQPLDLFLGEDGFEGIYVTRPSNKKKK